MFVNPATWSLLCYITASFQENHVFLVLDLRENKHWREEAKTYLPGSTVLVITVFVVFNL